MAFQAHRNLATSRVAVAPAPASSGLTLTVMAGEASRYPPVPFNATVKPFGEIPTPANAEIVTVTNVLFDVVTIVRAQEGSTARAIQVGDHLAATLTNKWMDDVEAAFLALSASNLLTGTVPQARKWTEATITLVGNQVDVAIGSADLLRCNNATDLTIQGIVAGVPGQRVTIMSVGAGNVFLAHQNGTEATATNRLINDATSGNTPLAAGKGVAVYVYDGTTGRWRLESHEQGDWISAAFNAGDYTAGGAMTITVAAGDMSRNTYYLRGRILFWGVQIDTFTLGGTPHTDIKIAVPGGFTLNDDAQNAVVTFNNAGALEIGRFYPNTVSPMNMTCNRAGVANWANGVDNNYISGSIFLPVL